MQRLLKKAPKHHVELSSNSNPSHEVNRTGQDPPLLGKNAC
jgi:hypothetical protein